MPSSRSDRRASRNPGPPPPVTDRAITPNTPNTPITPNEPSSGRTRQGSKALQRSPKKGKVEDKP